MSIAPTNNTSSAGKIIEGIANIGIQAGAGALAGAVFGIVHPVGGAIFGATLAASHYLGRAITDCLPPGEQPAKTSLKNRFLYLKLRFSPYRYGLCGIHPNNNGSIGHDGRDDPHNNCNHSCRLMHKRVSQS